MTHKIYNALWLVTQVEKFFTHIQHIAAAAVSFNNNMKFSMDI